MKGGFGTTGRNVSSLAIQVALCWICTGIFNMLDRQHNTPATSWPFHVVALAQVVGMHGDTYFTCFHPLQASCYRSMLLLSDHVLSIRQA